jgi:hypothetical protein
LDRHVAGAYVTLYSNVRNTTFLQGNTLYGIHFTTGIADSAVNCVFACAAIKASKASFTRCLFLDNGSNVDDGDMGDGSFRRPLEDFGLDGVGRPLAGSPVINAGDFSLDDDADVGERAFDCAGGQRVYDGAVDLGAYEYDFRPDYAKALARKSEVSVATSGVKLTDDGEIRLADGETLVAGWEDGANISYSMEFSFSVSSGNLQILRNGEVVGDFTADGTWTYKSAEPRDQLSFVYSGTGYALLNHARSLKGFVLSVR